MIQKHLGIQPPLHPVRPRCSSITHAQFAPSSRLASRAHALDGLPDRPLKQRPTGAYLRPERGVKPTAVGEQPGPQQRPGRPLRIVRPLRLPEIPRRTDPNRRLTMKRKTRCDRAVAPGQVHRTVVGPLGGHERRRYGSIGSPSTNRELPEQKVTRACRFNRSSRTDRARPRHGGPLGLPRVQSQYR